MRDNNSNNKWGYSVDKSKLIDLDKGDFDLYPAILQKVPGLRACIFCGSCSATCTVQQDGMNFRLIHLSLVRGEVNSLKELSAACLLCGKCTLICPRNIDTRSVVYNLRILLHELI